MSLLASEAEILNLERGEVFFEEGSESNALFLLMEGVIEFSKRTGENTFHPVSTSVAGEFFGEVGVLADQPRSLRASVQSAAVVASIPREVLLYVIHRNASPEDWALKSVVRHLHDTTTHFMQEALKREKKAVVGNMVNSIIHDFKNPMACIRAGMDFLSRTQRDETTARICDTINNQIDQMLAMADEVILYARGEVDPKFAPVHLPTLAERFRQMNPTFFEREDTAISLEMEDVSLEAEEGKLLRILENLVGNAIEADTDGCKIEIRGTSRDDFVEIRVADNAGGIPVEIRDKFFDPFVTHGKKRGTGLGTAIVKSLVDAHGGEIVFECEDGVGTVFTITLPKSQAGRYFGGQI